MQSKSSITSISSDVTSMRQPSYVPDFTVKATQDVMYLQIRRAHYMAAYRATLMQKERETPQVRHRGSCHSPGGSLPKF